MTPDALRSLIHRVAAATPEIGPLEESLKWGEQSFTPARRNVGSSVRIARRKDGSLALTYELRKRQKPA